ncbi:carboxylesterase/lipase family protein [Nonomuraea sp. NPDC050383]|uniref:carboxylesterase/lipase family protein n=1 Tax=Nonomuraea sp. NPDC050383 TaxID=3364362 RepID=UPI0037921932
MNDLNPVVSTGQGSLQGSWDGRVASFLGVPFAAAPVGDLRFAAPQPHARWQGIRPATAFGPAAPQPPANPDKPVDAMQLLTGSPSLAQAEDNCLTLNIWTPGLTGSPRAVLVWIHGSGWLSGASAWPGYHGQNLAAAEDIVVVTANYRLGPLGFLRVPGVAEGNMGFLDVVAALRWVRENIADFGGDPDRVTVAGQSGGAVTSVALLTSPSASGLFRRVFAQSGPIGIPMPSPAEAEQTGAEYMNVLGLTPATAHRLRDLPAEQLVTGYQQLVAGGGRRRIGAPAPPMHPIAGGPGLPTPVLSALADGAGSGIDVLLGATAEEMNPFLAIDPSAAAITREAVLQILERLAPGPAGGDVYDHYADRRPGATPSQVLADITTDRLVRLPALQVAEARARHGHPGYVYQVDWRSPGLGACHTVDIPLLLDNLPAWSASPMFRSVDPVTVEPIGSTFRRAVAAFVRTGNPNTQGVPMWEAYTPADRLTMCFDTLTIALGDPARGERRLLPAPIQDLAGQPEAPQADDAGR